MVLLKKKKKNTNQVAVKDSQKFRDKSFQTFWGKFDVSVNSC